MRAVFSSQLCQLLTTRPSLENRTKHNKKKGSHEAFCRQYTSLKRTCSNFRSCYRSNTGLGGWAKDKSSRQHPLLPGSIHCCPFVLQKECRDSSIGAERARARASPNFPSLSVSARARARASCSRESLLVPAGPFRINIGYRVSLRLLAETSVAAVRGLRGRVHTRAKIAS